MPLSRLLCLLLCLLLLLLLCLVLLLLLLVLLLLGTSEWACWGSAAPLLLTGLPQLCQLPDQLLEVPCV